MKLFIIHRLRMFIFIVLTVGLSSSLSLIGGVALESIHTIILPLVPLVVAIPALNTVVGDYAAIIAAHAGDPNEAGSTRKELYANIVKVIWINIAGIVLFSAIVSVIRGYELEPYFLLKFALFVIVAIISVVILVAILTRLLDKLLERKRLNSDDVLIPIITSLTDVFMLGIVALAAVLIF